jgi:formylglycine-generating enzyme required for sulfatase activity
MANSVFLAYLRSKIPHAPARGKGVNIMTDFPPKKFFFVLFVLGCLFVFISHPLHAAVVRGAVTAVEGEYIRIDKGSEAGLKVGDQGMIYYIVLVGKERRPQPIYVANVTITSADQTSAEARVDKAQGEIMVGYLVETTLAEAPPAPIIIPEQPPSAEPLPGMSPAGQQLPEKKPLIKVVKKKKKRVVKRSVRPGELWRDPHLDMSFAWVPGGCFEMGCGDGAEGCGDSEKPVHKVCLNGFWIARHEVTQQQWRRLMGGNPSSFKRCGPQCPVEGVSWNEAVEFAKKLSAKTGYIFRLPTEAEWEYACRSGGKKQEYAGSEPVDALAWYKENADGSPHRVGKKHPNDLWIYDMSGNVWEWCLDIFDKEAYRKATGTLENPVFIGDQFADIYRDGYSHILSMVQGASGYRSVRGGSWGNVADRLRCTDRIKGNPDSRRDWLGFRLVREEMSKK